MLHHTVRAQPGRLLFVTWVEGLALWDRVVGAAAGLEALVLMPDHLHLLHPADVRSALAHALSGHARWLAARREVDGPLIRPIEAPDRALVGDKQRRSVRYVHLNPCRAGLVADPLAWPLSTHRDAVGLVARPVVEPRRDRARFHAYVSSDPTVSVDGTELPVTTVQIPDPSAVFAATSAFARVPVDELARRGPARDLYLAAARTLTASTLREIGALVGVSLPTVRRTAPSHGPLTRTLARLVGDARFEPLLGHDLRRTPAWRRYRDRR